MRAITCKTRIARPKTYFFSRTLISGIQEGLFELALTVKIGALPQPAKSSFLCATRTSPRSKSSLTRVEFSFRHEFTIGSCQRTFAPASFNKVTTCSAGVWSATQVYTGGQRAAYNGQLFEAKWWTQGENPSQSGQWGVWKSVGSCTSGSTPAPTPTPSPTPTPTQTPICTVWAEGKSYSAGVIVSYQGKQYKALVAHTAWVGAGWNPQSTPTLWQATNGTSCQ